MQDVYTIITAVMLQILKDQIIYRQSASCTGISVPPETASQ